jgi:hypothetical protein
MYPVSIRLVPSRAEEILRSKAHVGIDILLVIAADPPPQIVPTLIFHQLRSQRSRDSGIDCFLS